MIGEFLFNVSQSLKFHSIRYEIEIVPANEKKQKQIS